MTVPERSAVDRAVDEIEAVRRFWYPQPAPARLELEALPADLLYELAGLASLAEPAHMVSDRGFIQFDYIDLGGDRRVRVYESSAASEPKVWLRLVDDEGMACTQLTLGQARLLADQLMWLIPHHHMTENGRPTAVDEEVDRRTDAAADRADTIIDRYDPDDRQPAAGDPYWSEEPSWDD